MFGVPPEDYGLINQQQDWIRISLMKRPAIILFLLAIATVTLRAQVVESANARSFTIDVGGMGSAFAPNVTGLSQPPYLINAPANYLIGVGTYADLHFSHWVQLEGEARWLRLNEKNDEFEDHYLIGPKVPLLRLGRAQIYGKGMIGLGRLHFSGGHAYCTAIALGGGVDYRVSRKLTFRPVDFEFQDWPKFLDKASSRPYGVSVGVSYRVF